MSISTDAFYDNIAAIKDYANSINNAAPIWQSFKSGSNQYLYGVQLYIKTPDTVIGGQPINANGINIIIYNGTGIAGSVFAQLSAANVPATGPTWYTFVMPSPFVTLTSGATYTIAVSGTGSGNLLWGYSYSTPQSTYPDGEASFQPASDLFFKVQITPVPVDPNIPNTFNFIEVQDGSAVAPSYTFTNDLTTGVYRIPAGSGDGGAAGVAITSSGVNVLNIVQSGVIPNVSGNVALGSTLKRFNNLFLSGTGAQPFFESGTAFVILQGSITDPTGIVYTTQTLNYIKLGVLYFIQGQLNWSSIGVLGTGNIIINVSLVSNNNINLMNVVLDNFSYAAAPNASLAGISDVNGFMTIAATTSGAATYTLNWATDLGLGAAGITFSGFIQITPP
jgi:hypothetical protein